MDAARTPPPQRLKRGWRHAALAGLAAGLAVSPLTAIGAPAELFATATVAAALVALARPHGPGMGATAAWLAAVVLVAAAIGLAVGSARVAAIDGNALRGERGARVELRGVVVGRPRPDAEGWSAELDTDAGRALAVAPDLDELEVGDRVEVSGRLAPVPSWREQFLRVRGIAVALAVDRVERQGRRSGLEGRIDEVRRRAEGALGRGMPERESALARGFVLGEDEGIDPETREDFRRSGLAHLLAVSGQNVLLLCLLAWPLLALAGLTLRARLLTLLALIALYVPLTGAGPSIQRAALMGAAGLVAALASRPASRWYALLFAAVVTLALNPHASADLGWQLSFAAVVGIFLWSRRLGDALGAGAERGSPRRALADGAAMTIAATVATAPLVAHHFESLQLAALPANLAALPAVAPAMWLGMLAGIVGQVGLLPVEPLNWINSLCLAYIAQVARWFGDPGWAQLEIGLRGPLELAAAFAVLAAAVELGLAAAARRRGLAPRSRRHPRRIAITAAVLAAALLVAPAIAPPDPSRGGDAAFRARVLDVGQGDAILLDPPASDPVLVDAGPPGAALASRLRELGVDSLAAVVISHDQSDHAGGLAELLRALPVDRLALGVAAPRLSALSEAAGVETVRLTEGSELRVGALRLTALWPPRELTATAEDPNARSLVLVADWRHLSLLLTGDAEAEAVPLDPGPVDVLKVAHHGSTDEGLGELLERTAPKLAVISVGDNSYGHPAAPTLATLGEQGVPVARTDRDGEITIEADARGWTVAPAP